MRIPFTKAHGAKNDFLLTWAREAPPADLGQAAIAICDRSTGVGADGWLVVEPSSPGSAARLRLFNADGTEVEMSGNGTRCAAAFLIDAGLADVEIPLITGAGLKHLKLLERDGTRFLLEMNMGAPVMAPADLRFPLPLSAGPREVAILNVGNPQCAVFVSDFDFDWRTLGAEIEAHRRFPRRSNVSFVRVLDEHTLDVRFYERGVGVTNSSGTGATGAVAAAIARGEASTPVEVRTPAGPLQFRWEGPEIQMIGPAELVAAGEFFYSAPARHA
jgi:diaminopimelate epimerase